MRTILSVSKRGIDPDTASLVREALSLPAGERIGLDAELDATSQAYSDLTDQIPLWRLKDTPGLWARLQDAATAFEVDRSALSHQLDGAMGRTLTEAMVRRNVRDSDVDTSSVSNPPGPLTASPAGVLMLNLDALMLLGMKARGERGDRLALQIKAIIDAFPKLQRVCVRLLQAHRQVPAPVVAPSIELERLRLEVELEQARRQNKALDLLVLEKQQGKKRPDPRVAELALGPRRRRTPTGNAPPQAALPGPVEDVELVIINPEQSGIPVITEFELEAFPRTLTDVAKGLGYDTNTKRARKVLEQFRVFEDEMSHVYRLVPMPDLPPINGQLQYRRQHRFRSDIVPYLIRLMNTEGSPLFGGGR